MINIYDVAELAGVSKSSVSRYFNGGSLSDKSAKKIEAAIKELNYKPNFVGKVLKDNSTHLIGICIPLMSHPFFAKFIQAVNKEVYKHNYSLIILESENKFEKESESIDLIHHNKVDGLIFVTHNANLPFDFNIPIVTIDRHIEGVPCVSSNNYDSTYNALEYLYKKGLRHIGFLGGRPEMPSEVNLRYEAYIDFIKKHHLENHSLFEPINHGGEYKKSQDFLKKERNLDACFCSSDAFAFSLYRINKNLKIIAFDGCMQDWIQFPKFTSVRQDIDALAKKAVEILFDRINKKHVESKYIIDTEFILGETA